MTPHQPPAEPVCPTSLAICPTPAWPRSKSCWRPPEPPRVARPNRPPASLARSAKTADEAPPATGDRLNEPPDDWMDFLYLGREADAEDAVSFTLDEPATARTAGDRVERTDAQGLA